MEFDPNKLSWLAAPTPAAERIGRSYNALRVLIIIGVMLLGFALTLVLLSAMPSVAFGRAPAFWPVAVALVLVLCLIIKVVGRRWGKAVSMATARQLVFGAPGDALLSGWTRFRREDIAKGVEGERWTAQALEMLLAIPGTRILHGLRFPGSHVADVDHAVINGDRVVYVDSKFWKPGQYQWVDSETLASVHPRGLRRRPIHMDVLQTHPLTAKVGAEMTCHVIVHANAPGDVTFTPGRQISPTGIPVTGVQEGIDMIGHWLLQGKKAGTVDRYALARLLSLRKRARSDAGTRRGSRPLLAVQRRPAANFRPRRPAANFRPRRSARGFRPY
ncbi:nuclease-related domain-containing protein [Arthrobacter sp. CAU 1506]|uniref:nuclease-related domain-containing protein n=1 Tax=Arthrobacter sp. CAU 1506 TaxID=2560052 RepID=UPI00145CC820|nr:nuclease-related domain-containing protein [Arthrobacter sp. CAU 1506]